MSLRPEQLRELDRWAAERAPELVARAEAEAVAALRDALVRASLESRRTAGEPGRAAGEPGRAAGEPGRAAGEPGRAAGDATPDPEPPAAEPAPAIDDGVDLVWAYCVLRASDPMPPEALGIDRRPLERVESDGLAALVSRVPAAAFAQEPLTRNLNDLTWLERVARAHEAVLDAALERTTIVPLRMCTIFESERGVIDMLVRRRESLADALAALDGRLEWAVKVLIDGDRLTEAAGALEGDPARPARAGEGGAYLQRRRDERGAREAAGRLAADTAEQIHARLQDWALDARTSPPQNRELSGHEGEMVLNAAYLVERDRSEELRGIVAELEAHHHELGARIELSGPWPPYNFVPGGAAADGVG